MHSSFVPQICSPAFEGEKAQQMEISVYRLLHIYILVMPVFFVSWALICFSIDSLRRSTSIWMAVYFIARFGMKARIVH